MGSTERIAGDVSTTAQPAPAATSGLWLALVPGAPGGVALGVDGVVDAQPMPANPDAVLALLRSVKAAADKSGVETVCVLEQVRGPTDERRGFLQGVALGLGMRLVRVTPEVWTAFILPRPAGSPPPLQWQLAHKLELEAQWRYPQFRVTPETARALLILDWVRATPCGGTT